MIGWLVEHWCVDDVSACDSHDAVWSMSLVSAAAAAAVAMVTMMLFGSVVDVCSWS